jgi:hypothetical protein
LQVADFDTREAYWLRVLRSQDDHFVGRIHNILLSTGAYNIGDLIRFSVENVVRVREGEVDEADCWGDVDDRSPRTAALLNMFQLVKRNPVKWHSHTEGRVNLESFYGR